MHTIKRVKLEREGRGGRKKEGGREGFCILYYRRLFTTLKCLIILLGAKFNLQRYIPIMYYLTYYIFMDAYL